MKQGVCFAGKIRHENFEEAVAVEVFGVCTHAAARAAVRIKSHAGFECYFGKCSSAVIVKKEICRSVIGLKNIEAAVVVIVQSNDSQAFSFEVCDSCLLTNIREDAVAIVVKEPACRA